LILAQGASTAGALHRTAALHAPWPIEPMPTIVL
jgi:hypothetical protein